MFGLRPLDNYKTIGQFWTPKPSTSLGPALLYFFEDLKRVYYSVPANVDVSWLLVVEEKKQR